VVALARLRGRECRLFARRVGTVSPHSSRRGFLGIVTTSRSVRGRILVAEDSSLLLPAGHWHRAGRAGGAATGGVLSARERALDGALLGIKLRTELCFPAASILLARSIPFTFVTGYNDKSSIPSRFAERP
jgi:hypothetical protein